MTSSVINAWAKKSGTGVPPIDVPSVMPNMRQIIDEEVARQLQDAENKKSLDIPASRVDPIQPTAAKLRDAIDDDWSVAAAAILGAEGDSKTDQDEDQSSCANDFMLAQLLQSQFDREHDKILALEEKKWNGNEKVQVSFQNYRTQRSQDLYGVDSSSGDESEDEDMKELCNIKLESSRRVPDFGASGVIKKDGKLITKHDKVVCGRKNTDRVMEFPPEFQTGDAVKMDVLLSNNVYNKLKTHMIQEEKRMQRVLDKKDKSTSELALDMNTRIVIYKMINSGMLESVAGIIATGKEAVVLYAKGGDSVEERVAIPAECALKVYITMLVDFKNRSQYVKEDYRFKNRRKVLRIWAEKELMNLNRMRRAGVRCPSVVKLKKHVLIMSFIGENGIPASKLKDVTFVDHDKLQRAFDQCVEAIKLMYDECKLVHGDFSEFNVLYWKEDCYIIDVAQSIDLSHPKSLIFLARDCYNLVKYFKKIGLESTPSDRELFVDITGYDQFISDDEFYVELEEYVNENTYQNKRREKRTNNNAESRVDFTNSKGRSNLDVDIYD